MHQLYGVRLNRWRVRANMEAQRCAVRLDDVERKLSLRFRQPLAAAARCLVTRGRRPPGRRRGLDARALPRGPADPASAADRRDPRVGRDRPG